MCGLVGVWMSSLAAETDVAELGVNLLLRLQHRGQDGAGLTVLRENGEFRTIRGLGLVRDALRDWGELPQGLACLAHTRYATTGLGGVAELQPFVKGRPTLAMAHNGNIVNADDLAARYGLELESTSDLDVIQGLFLKHTLLRRERQRNVSADSAQVESESIQDIFVAGLQAIADEVQGAYALIGLDSAGAMFGFRDPFGIRPLFMAKSAHGVLLASETAALAPMKTLWKDLTIEEVPASHWIYVDHRGIRRGEIQSRLNPQQKKSFCMFESVYFSSPQSELPEGSVFSLRFNLGRVLAQEMAKEMIQGNAKEMKVSHSVSAAQHSAYSSRRFDFDYVVPVPETSRVAAVAVAEELGVPYREYLIKNPYIPRTFILSEQAQRLKALESKLSLVGPELKGQRILLVDDSVVRGNTTRVMAARLRESGAAKVYMASTCPPIRHGCFYGIDFPDENELVATHRDLQQIQDELGVDGIYYISIEGLQKALGARSHCTGCLTGIYPVGSEWFGQFRGKRIGDRGVSNTADHASTDTPIKFGGAQT